MSYILEALKKAQAERQLGATPTIHAPTLDGGAGVPRGVAIRKPLAIAIGVMAAVIVLLLVLVFRQQAAPVNAQAPATLSPASAAQPPVAVQPPATAALAPVAPQQPASAALPPATQQPVIAAPPSVAAQQSAPAVPAQAGHAVPAGRSDMAATTASRNAAAPVLKAEQAPAPPPAQAEVTQTLRDLPEPIQRAIPQITFGGYMYSKNPADRMVLIDKVLRKEGDEVAPGLVLEQLLPKGAVFSFRGYRYRVSL
jgi:general secretion pathway protein B